MLYVSFSIDARPIDAIAIALRFRATIYVDDKLFEGSKRVDGEFEIFDTSKEGKKWAEYLKNLKPEAFSKYKM